MRALVHGQGEEWRTLAHVDFGDYPELALWMWEHAKDEWPGDDGAPATEDGMVRVWCEPPLVSMAVRGGLPIDEVRPELRALQQALFTMQAHGCKCRVLWYRCTPAPP